MPRKKLTDIILNSERDRLMGEWKSVKAADDQKPIPGGQYRARVVNGELFESKSQTPGFKITFEVIDGECAGRRFWHDVWLTTAAMSMAKRDLLKLGIVDFSQLERPLPDGIIVACRVALRVSDDGADFNRVVRFEVVEVETPSPEPFAPAAPKPSDTLPLFEAADTTGVGSRDTNGFDWKDGTESPEAMP